MAQLININRKQPCRIISFSSGKGGVGKTSLAVNIATSLADRNKRVLLIDGDLGLANVDIVLGLNVQHTIQETLDRGEPLETILAQITPGFFVLPASSGVPEMANLSYEEQAYLLGAVEALFDQFDYVLVDTAAGIGESVLWFNKWARENIVILTPDPTSMTDAYALMKVLQKEFGKKDFYLLVNNVKSKKEGEALFANIGTVLAKFLAIKPELLGIVPSDTQVIAALRSQKPFLVSAPECRAAKAVHAIAAKLLNGF